MLRDLLKSRFFIAAAALALVLTLFFLARELHKEYQINQEIRQLENEISALSGKNQEMSQLINYLKTKEYKERQARSLLNLQKSGEIAVVLPQQETGSTTLAEGTLGHKKQNSNYLKWWEYFFKEK